MARFCHLLSGSSPLLHFSHLRLGLGWRASAASTIKIDHSEKGASEGWGGGRGLVRYKTNNETGLQTAGLSGPIAKRKRKEATIIPSKTENYHLGPSLLPACLSEERIVGS